MVPTLMMVSAISVRFMGSSEHDGQKNERPHLHVAFALGDERFGLPLRVLEALACAGLAVLFALLLSSVAGQKARLLEREMAEQQAKIAAERKSQVGTGDRSGRIRTYNFPQGRITDHRIHMTIYKLDLFLDGEINDMIDALIAYNQAEALKNAD